MNSCDAISEHTCAMLCVSTSRVCPPALPAAATGTGRLHSAIVLYLSTPVPCCVFQAAECVLQHCLQLKQEQAGYEQLTQALETHCFKIMLASGVEVNIANISGNAINLFYSAGPHQSYRYIYII